MKLQFDSELMSGKMDYEDAFAVGAYSIENVSSPERMQSSYRHLGREDKRPAGTVDRCFQPLAQRLYSMLHEAPQAAQSRMSFQSPPSSYTSAFSSTLRSSSQRSERMFDEMIEREYKSQSVRLSPVVDAASDGETDFVPMYFCHQLLVDIHFLSYAPIADQLLTFPTAFFTPVLHFPFLRVFPHWSCIPC